MTLHLGPIDVDDPAPSTFGRDTLSLAGVVGAAEAADAAAAEMVRDQLLGLAGRVVPLRWDSEPQTNGWYRVEDVDAELDPWGVDDVLIEWSATLRRLGSVEFASQLTGNGRQRDPGWPVPERWAAPPRGHRALYAGAGLSPASVARAAESGPVVVYRQLPDVDPRWVVDLDDFYAGAVTLHHGGGQVLGTDVDDDPAGWMLANELVRVTPAANGRLLVAAWNGAAWAETSFEVRFGATPIATWHGFTVLRNDPEEVTLQLLRDHNPGRLTANLTLKRGARHVAVYLQRHVAIDLTVAREAAEAATGMTGGLYSTGITNGIRWALASARAATADLVNGTLTKAATRTFDVMIGVTPDAQAGDAPADLVAQYLGSPEERVEAVPR